MKTPTDRGSVAKRLEALRPIVSPIVVVTCLVVSVVLLQALNHFAPLRNWFFWKLATFWFWELIFVTGCLSLGLLVCKRALRDVLGMPALERLVLALASGAAAFAFLLYVAGALRLLHPTFAVALPLAAIGAAVVWARSDVMATLRELRDTRWEMSPLRMIVTAFGVVAVALVYLHILLPEALNHDAHWTHVVNAQDYAREGRLVPLYAGWTRNYPHLASVVYTWCYLVPGLAEQERLLLIMHTEFVFFLGTLLAVIAATRWLTEEHAFGARTSWVAFFLFPSIFVYDSNLGGSADHVAAFFMLPLFLAFLRGSERFSVGLCALAGGLAGTALITKYQSSYVTLALGLVMATRLGRVAVRHFRSRGAAESSSPSLRQALVAAGAFAAAAILTSSPFFLENLVFYRNPVFPFMQDVFKGSTPTLPEAAWLVSNVATPIHVRAVPQFGPRLLNGLTTLFTFSFIPHYGFTNGVPYFGFLFTLLAPLSLVLRRGHRLRIGALVGGITILAWGMTYLVDRNLQIALPILVAVTAGMISRIWQLGWAARAALVPVIAIQVVWGADFMFEGPLQATIAYIRTGAAGQVNVRDTSYRREITRLLPKNAKVLLHSEHVSLGLDRTVYADLSESQGMFDYHKYRTPREAYDRFHSVGVTHLVWLETNLSVLPVKQSDIIFMALVKPLAAIPVGPYRLVEMPIVPPPLVSPYRVLVVGIPGYADGVYAIEELSKCEMRPPAMCSPPTITTGFDRDIAVGAIGDVDAALIAPGRRLEPAATDAALRARFLLAKTTAAYELYLVR